MPESTAPIEIPECEHLEFEVQAMVVRVTKVEGGPVVAYDTTITVCCAKCRQPFRWIGLPAGSSYSAPMTSVDGRELRAPIAPIGVDTDTSLPGFKIQMRGVH